MESTRTELLANRNWRFLKGHHAGAEAVADAVRAAMQGDVAPVAVPGRR